MFSKVMKPNSTYTTLAKLVHKKPHGCQIISINAEKNCSTPKDKTYTHTYIYLAT